MATGKQIAANRRNAKNSTGPRSEQGKSRSRLNATRDGLTGQIIALPEKDRALFEQLKAEMLADLNPKTVIERKLAQAIAWDTWRLDHLRAIEMNLYILGQQELSQQENEPDDDPIWDENDPIGPGDLDTAFADVRTFRTESRRLELMSLTA